MTQTHSTNGGQLATMRRYRHLMFGVLLGGVAISLGLRSLDFPLVAEVVYLLGFFGFLAIWQGTSIPLFDEREQQIEERACAVTLTITAFALIFGASAGRLLPLLTAYSYPTWLNAALYAFIAQFIVFAAVYGWFRFRQ